jgi:hypothetical protein
MKTKLLFILSAACFILSSCGAFQQTVTFPPAKDIFITSGDGNIQKPYTPIGEFVYADKGFNFLFIPVKEVNPDLILRTAVTDKIRQAGGDGMINMRMNYVPKTFLSAATIVVTGTIIKR